MLARDLDLGRGMRKGEGGDSAGVKSFEFSLTWPHIDPRYTGSDFFYPAASSSSSSSSTPPSVVG